MNGLSSFTKLCTGLFVGLFAVTLWMFFSMNSHQTALASMRSRTDDCLFYANQIQEQIAGSAGRSASQLESVDSLGTVIQPMLNDFRLTKNYRGLSQLGQEQIAGTDSAEQIYQLRFEGTELEPLVRFCHSLTRARQGLSVAEFTLTAAKVAAPKSFQPKETWTAVIILTQSVFSPTTPG